MPELPKTRSRRLLRHLAEDRQAGGAMALADRSVMDRIRSGEAAPTEED